MISWFYAVVGVALLAVGCAELTRPFVEEYVIGDYAGLLGDGPPASEVLVVRNPTDHDEVVVVECGSAVSSRWEVTVRAHGEVRGLAQLLARDVGASTCSVVR